MIEVTNGFFESDAVALARKLIGCRLYFNDGGGTIVETEAYTAGDPASHSFKGQTSRNAPMFGLPGHIYLYRSYGLHWCLNIVAGSPGSAVLVRALEPEKGLTEMFQRRGTNNIRLLCSGPGRLCQALGITGAYNGGSVLTPPFRLEMGTQKHAPVAGPRIGISRGMNSIWRFGAGTSPFLSRPFLSVGQDAAP